MEDTNRISLFKAAVDKMIATSEESYKTDRRWGGKLNTGRIRTYTQDEVQEIIESGDINSMKELSRSYFYSSGFYRRIIFYYGYLLTYSYLVIPHFKKKVNANSKTNYYQALSLCEDIDIKGFCAHVAVNVLVDGCYYGCFVEQKGQVSTMDLPFDYCRTRFKGFSGLDIVEFNLQYFSTITDSILRDMALNAYPKPIKKAYASYISGKGPQWAIIPEGIGLYFRIDDARPLFINTISAIDNFEAYRDLEIKKEENELKKILVQHLGVKNDGEFIIEPEEAEELHRGACNMLRNNESLDVLTTYAEVNVESLSDARQTINSNLETFQKLIYSESGSSPNIFAAEGNISLEQSIKNDMSLMMNLADQFSKAFKFLLNDNISNANVDYDFTILPISYYNNQEYIDETYKLATAGYSFLLPIIACGITQKQIVDIKVLENDVIDLETLFKPLNLSYTQTKTGNTGEDGASGGAPTKSNTSKSDKTITNTNGGTT